MEDVKFMTAKEKELVLTQWERFIKNGMKWEGFTRGLYNHLIQHCSFIAHYDRAGFYGTYFNNPVDTIRFIRHFDKDYDCMALKFSMPDYNDINEAMVDTMGLYKKDIYKRCKDTEKTTDLAMAKILLAKHGITLNI